jgi:hypothetical protein
MNDIMVVRLRSGGVVAFDPNATVDPILFSARPERIEEHVFLSDTLPVFETH